jgi:hypothetical protein
MSNCSGHESRDMIGVYGGENLAHHVALGVFGFFIYVFCFTLDFLVNG